MVHVKLFGLLQLDTGLKELDAEAATVGELYPILLREAKRRKPATTVRGAAYEPGLWGVM